MTDDAVREAVRQVPAPDGTSLGVREWTGPRPPTSDVLISHGHGEHSGRHRDWALRLAGSGFRVVAWDHRGHGLSGGPRGHVDRFGQLLDDLDAVVAATEAGAARPLAAYGHSMGGLVLVHYAVRHPTAFGSLAMTCPWFRLRLRPPAWKQWLADRAADWFPRLTLSTGLRSSQMAEEQQVELPDGEARWIHRKMSAAMYRELRRAAADARDGAATLRTPVLILQGLDDPIMDPAGARAFRDGSADGGFNGVRVVELPGRRHEPHNDVGREALQDKMIAWFRGEPLPPANPTT